MIGYVYLTKNMVNGRPYIGSHIAPSFDKKYYGSGTALIRALKKHGKENFRRRIVFKAESQDDLIKMETHFIKKIIKKHGKNSYNIALDARSPMLGRRHSDSFKKLASARTSGDKNPMYGVHLSGEKNPMYGKKQSEETRRKIGIRLSAYSGENHWNTGLVRSAETRKKESDSKLGKNMRDDLITKIMLERGVFITNLSSAMRNIVSSYRTGSYQKEKTIKSNIQRFCSHIGAEDKIEILISSYVADREYYGVSRCS